MHQAELVTIATLRWLLGKTTAVLGEARLAELSPKDFYAWRLTIPERRNVVRRGQDGEPPPTPNPRNVETCNDASTPVAFPPKRDSYVVWAGARRDDARCATVRAPTIGEPWAALSRCSGSIPAV